MHTRQTSQHGASTLGLIIILAVIGVGAYIGLQYIPQYIEAGTMDVILGNLEDANNEKHVTSVQQVQDMIDRQLNINQMEDLRDNFKITQIDETFDITVSYERVLNLIYEKKIIAYEKHITLE